MTSAGMDSVELSRHSDFVKDSVSERTAVSRVIQPRVPTTCSIFVVEFPSGFSPSFTRSDLKMSVQAFQARRFIDNDKLCTLKGEKLLFSR